jgi:hypothetical protein
VPVGKCSVNDAGTGSPADDAAEVKRAGGDVAPRPGNDGEKNRDVRNKDKRHTSDKQAKHDPKAKKDKPAKKSGKRGGLQRLSERRGKGALGLRDRVG